MTSTHSAIKSLKSEVVQSFYGNTTVVITAENLATAKRLIAREIKQRENGKGHIDCRRWQFSEVLGHEAYTCGVDEPHVGDILVMQCGQVG